MVLETVDSQGAEMQVGSVTFQIIQNADARVGRESKFWRLGSRTSRNHDCSQDQKKS